jgi:hypothetical protein
MNDARNPIPVSRLPLTTREQFGTAGTVATVEHSELGPLTAPHIAAISGRGLDVELLVRLGVGASPKLGDDAIGIPYFVGDVRVGCKHRTLTGEKRFVQDVGSRQVLCNHNCLTDGTLKAEPLLVVEGELDMFSAIQSGFPRTVSVPGGAPLQQTAIDDGRKYQFLVEAEPLLEDVREIILAVDGDGPGANLRHDLALRLGAHRCKWVKYPAACKDLNDVLRRHESKGLLQLYAAPSRWRSKATSSSISCRRSNRRPHTTRVLSGLGSTTSFDWATWPW